VETSLVSIADGDTSLRDAVVGRWDEVRDEGAASLVSCHAVLIRLDAVDAGAVLLPDEPVTIGRGPEARVAVDDESVSRIHATIELVDGSYEIVDHASRGGVFVGRRKVQRTVLTDGDIVQLGSRVCFRFKLLSLEAGPAGELRSSKPASALVREYLQYRLRAEVALALRVRAELSIALFHIDRLSSLTATKGDGAREAARKLVWQTVNAELSAHDLLARYGDGELIAVLANTKLDDAARLCEKIRVQLAGDAPQGEPISVSVGIAALTCCPQPNLQRLIACADRRLFAARREGGNRVLSD
jgi:two-component system, cell cycle response regulator